jgi:hypothetical protein
MIICASDRHRKPGELHEPYLRFLDYVLEARPRYFIQLGDIDECGAWFPFEAIWQDPISRAEIEKERELARHVTTIRTCLTTDTSVLTQRGWVTYDRLSPEDLVLSLDLATNRVQWGPITKQYIGDYTGPIVNIHSSRATNQMMTPDHAVLMQPPLFYPWRYKMAKDLVNRHSPFLIPVAGHIDKPDYPIPGDLIRLLAWVVTEGTYLKGAEKGLQVYQSIDGHLDEIIGILQRLAVPYSIYNGKGERNKVIYIHGSYCPQIKHWLPNKFDISAILSYFSERQLVLFAEEFLKGDGTSKNTSGEFYTSKKKLAEQLVWLCSLIGWRSHIRERTREKWGKLFTGYTVSFTRLKATSRIECPVEDYVEEDSYQGLVFDLTTLYGNFLAMRDGKPFFTGNCGNHDWNIYDYEKYLKPINLAAPKFEMDGIEYSHWHEYDPSTKYIWTPLTKNKCIKRHLPKLYIKLYGSPAYIGLISPQKYQWLVEAYHEHFERLVMEDGISRCGGHTHYAFVDGKPNGRWVGNCGSASLMSWLEITDWGWRVRNIDELD